MAKTNFVNGTAVTSAFLNAINNPVFLANPNNDGELPLVTNDALSNEPGQLKPEWTTFRDLLKVSAGKGLSITFTGGAVTLPNGVILAIEPGTLVLPNNASSYVFVDSSGVVTSSTTYPVVALPLALVVTLAGVVQTIADLRPRFRVQPIANAIKVFGGTGEQGDYSLTSGSATFSDGFYYYRNFTVAAGATLNINKFARIFCSGTVNIAGTVIVSTLAIGGASFSTQLVGANIGGLSGAGPGAGSGSSATGGQSYSYAAAPYGSGGASGFVNFDSGGAGNLGAGGAGGGGLWIEAAGPISVSGTITAKGAVGGAGVLLYGTGNISGGGGGSGGLVLLSSLSSVIVTSAATIDVRGGNGGAAAAGAGAGGAGGGGGLVVLISPSYNTTGSTILLTAGSRGTTLGAGSLGGGGGGGFGGAGGGGAGGTPQAGQLILRGFRAVG